MDVENNWVGVVITCILAGTVAMIGLSILKPFKTVKNLIDKILIKFFPGFLKPVIMETVLIKPRVNCQAVVLLENLPKCTTPKDLVKFLNLKEFVTGKKLMKVSVAADKQGHCAGLAVAVCPRFCLQHSNILKKNNSIYHGNVIKVKEVQNRKLNFRKHVNWLSSENWSQVGLRGRFQVFNNLLQDITTQHGYYLIDGGSFLQYFDHGPDIVASASTCGIYKMVMKMRNPRSIATAEINWCKTYPGYLYLAAGVWNDYANIHSKNPEAFYTLIKEQLDHPWNKKYIVAIGECGITKKSTVLQDQRIDNQIKLFTQMVELADLYHKPILVKTLDGVKEMLEILAKHPNVTACLTVGHENPPAKQVTEWIKKGHYLAISAGLWISPEKGPRILDKLHTVPLDKLMLSSNALWLEYGESYKKDSFILEISKCDDFRNVQKDSIEIYKTEQGEESHFVPAGLNIVLELMSARLNKSPVVLASILNANAERFYKFDSLDEN